MADYASKTISTKAKQSPTMIKLCFGEPEFGPPEYMKEEINRFLTYNSFIESVKSYENSRGSLELRQTIADWYKRRYNINIDPETEIMVTHGGVEAITLAILVTSELSGKVAITDPSYMLYKRAIENLGRQPVILRRDTTDRQYSNLLSNSYEVEKLAKASAIIINSPENPSGYVLSKQEWSDINQYACSNNLWVIHDEVYDTMAFDRKHTPFNKEHSLIINSFSKKFGIPGIRVGWLIGNRDVINLASRAHDYHYLGVNQQYEKIANILLSNSKNDDWFSQVSQKIQSRINWALVELGSDQGFEWSRRPMGAMFLFPNINGLYQFISPYYREKFTSPGEAVAQFLMNELDIAVVPGFSYGQGSEHYIRMVLCGSDSEYDEAINRLSCLKIDKKSKIVAMSQV